MCPRRFSGSQSSSLIKMSRGFASFSFQVAARPSPYHPCTHRIHGTGIFTYIDHKNQPNVDTYTIHGSYGVWYAYNLVGLYSKCIIGKPWKSKGGFPNSRLWKDGFLRVSCKDGYSRFKDLNTLRTHNACHTSERIH